MTEHFRIHSGESKEVEVWWKQNPSSDQAAESTDTMPDASTAILSTHPSSAIQSEPKIQREVAQWILERRGSLGLHGIHPTFQSVGQLKACKALVSLFVQSSGIDDESMAKVAQLTSLESLTLSSNRVTLKGLLCLKDSVKLKSLFLNEPNLTPADVDALHKALPSGIKIRIAD